MAEPAAVSAATIAAAHSASIHMGSTADPCDSERDEGCGRERGNGAEAEAAAAAAADAVEPAAIAQILSPVATRGAV